MLRSTRGLGPQRSLQLADWGPMRAERLHQAGDVQHLVRAIELCFGVIPEYDPGEELDGRIASSL